MIKRYTKFVSEDIKFVSVDNQSIHETKIKHLGTVELPDPEHGDLKLSVMPFTNTNERISLPEGFKQWEDSLNQIMKMVPLQEGADQHYVTIDSKFFTTDDFLRREGVHVDGNFCVDPKFSFANYDLVKEGWGGASPTTRETWGGASPAIDREESQDDVFGDAVKSSWGGASPEPAPKSSWGGASPEPAPKSSWGGASPMKSSWGGARFESYVVKEDNSHVNMDWVLPYKLVIPIGDYITEKKGGIITVSTEVGCQAWEGTYRGEVLSEGAYDNMLDQLKNEDKVVFEKNELYFMTSNTPHETLMIDKGNRRTFMRITLNHEYLNEKI